MTFSDLLFSNLAALGVDYCACVPGGGIMYLVDSVGRNEHISVKYFHHEQSAGIAAEAYSKAKNFPSACLVTIGPGVANAVSSAFSAFVNSVPVIFISGAKRSSVPSNYQLQRFTFPQDADTRALVSGVVKGYWELSSIENLEKTIKTAYNLASSGRPGPVWISIPLDVQGKKVESPSPKERKRNKQPKRDISIELQNFLNSANRTVFIMGDGVSSVVKDEGYKNFLRNINLPCITSIGSNHTITSANELNLGIFGPVGRRAANIALSKADSIVALGTGLDIDLTGFDREGFFSNKKLLQINSDPNLEMHEANDFSRIIVDIGDLDFSLLQNISHGQSIWANSCIKLNKFLSTDFETRYHKNDQCTGVDPYFFSSKIGNMLGDKAAIVAGISLDVVSLSHSISLKPSQRLFISKHCGQLGWDIPATLGVAHTNMYEQIVCVTGDGSIMFNLQELATLSVVPQHVHIFIYDNDGYNSIRTSQHTHLEGRLFGSTLNDLSFPDWKKLAQAFGFTYFEISADSQVEEEILGSLSVLKSLTLIKVDSNRSRTPRLVSKIVDGKFQSPNLAEQYPYLDETIQKMVDGIFE